MKRILALLLILALCLSVAAAAPAQSQDNSPDSGITDVTTAPEDPTNPVPPTESPPGNEREGH